MAVVVGAEAVRAGALGVVVAEIEARRASALCVVAVAAERHDATHIYRKCVECAECARVDEMSRRGYLTPRVGLTRRTPSRDTRLVEQGPDWAAAGWVWTDQPW